MVFRYARLTVMGGLGAFALVAGQFDDSPGLQGIGLIVVSVALALHWQWMRRERKESPAS